MAVITYTGHDNLQRMLDEHFKKIIWYHVPCVHLPHGDQMRKEASSEETFGLQAYTIKQMLLIIIIIIIIIIIHIKILKKESIFS